jgi:hypothetical protein
MRELRDLRPCLHWDNRSHSVNISRSHGRDIFHRNSVIVPVDINAVLIIRIVAIVHFSVDLKSVASSL